MLGPSVCGRKKLEECCLRKVVASKDPASAAVAAVGHQVDAGPESTPRRRHLSTSPQHQCRATSDFHYRSSDLHLGKSKFKFELR